MKNFSLHKMGWITLFSLTFLQSCASPARYPTSIEHPYNQREYNNACPKEWLGKKFHDSYLRNDGESQQHVCDYSGSVKQAECDASGAMSTGGPHGQWCQIWQNDHGQLLSLARTPN